MSDTTKLRAKGPGASHVRNVCAMNEPEPFGQGTYAEPGVFTWRLHAPARSVAEVVRHAATEAVINTGE